MTALAADCTVNKTENCLWSTCDAKLTFYPTPQNTFWIKVQEEHISTQDVTILGMFFFFFSQRCGLISVCRLQTVKWGHCSSGKSVNQLNCSRECHLAALQPCLPQLWHQLMMFIWLKRPQSAGLPQLAAVKVAAGLVDVQVIVSCPFWLVRPCAQRATIHNYLFWSSTQRFTIKSMITCAFMHVVKSRHI